MLTVLCQYWLCNPEDRGLDPSVPLHARPSKIRLLGLLVVVVQSLSRV